MSEAASTPSYQSNSSVVVTLGLPVANAPAGEDNTTPDDDHADADDPRVSELPELIP